MNNERQLQKKNAMQFEHIPSKRPKKIIPHCFDSVQLAARTNRLMEIKKHTQMRTLYGLHARVLRSFHL